MKFLSRRATFKSGLISTVAQRPQALKQKRITFFTAVVGNGDFHRLTVSHQNEQFPGTGHGGIKEISSQHHVVTLEQRENDTGIFTALGFVDLRGIKAQNTSVGEAHVAEAAFADGTAAGLVEAFAAVIGGQIYPVGGLAGVTAANTAIGHRRPDDLAVLQRRGRIVRIGAGDGLLEAQSNAAVAIVEGSGPGCEAGTFDRAVDHIPPGIDRMQHHLSSLNRL